MSYCLKCGTKLEENAKFCSYCGERTTFPSDVPLKFETIKCPECGATVKYKEFKDSLTCEYCGADIVINDKATELNRILTAETNAKKRNSQISIEYEEHRQKLKIREDIINFVIENPIFSIVAALLLVNAIRSLIQGTFAGIDVIIIAVILHLINKKTNRNKQE